MLELKLNYKNWQLIFFFRFVEVWIKKKKKKKNRLPYSVHVGFFIHIIPQRNKKINIQFLNISAQWCKWWNIWCFKHKSGGFLFSLRQILKTVEFKCMKTRAWKIYFYALKWQISQIRHWWNNIYKTKCSATIAFALHIKAAKKALKFDLSRPNSVFNKISVGNSIKEEFHFSDVYRSINYIGSRAFIRGSFTMHATQCSLYFDKRQKN